MDSAFLYLLLSRGCFLNGVYFSRFLGFSLQAPAQSCPNFSDCFNVPKHYGWFDDFNLLNFDLLYCIGKLPYFLTLSRGCRLLSFYPPFLLLIKQQPALAHLGASLLRFRVLGLGIIGFSADRVSNRHQARRL